METRSFDKRIFFGTILLVIGVLILGTNLGFIPYNIRHFLLSWRMLIIVIGLSQLLFTRNKAVGVLLIAVGTFFYLPEIWDLPVRVRDLFWPVMIIALGLIFIFRQTNFASREPIDTSTGDFIDDVAIFGGSERIITSQNFKGGKVTSVFGGSNFIFGQSKLAPTGAVVDVFSLFGGSKFIVPKDWNVQVEVTPILGGFTDKRITMTGEPNQPLLIIKGLVIFGGGEVANY